MFQVREADGEIVVTLHFGSEMRTSAFRRAARRPGRTVWMLVLGVWCEIV